MIMQKLCRKDIASIDLNKGLVRSYCGTVLATGDNMANCFGVEIYRNGEAVNVDGYAVTGYFIYQNGAETIVVKGKAEGNTAIVELPQACYAHEGGFSLTIKVSGTDVTAAVRVIDGNIRQTATETLIDPGEVVPSLDELFAQIERMETATAEAEAAATNYAPPIVAEQMLYEGGGAAISDATGNRALQGLHVYGKTTQNVEPTPDAPVDLVSVGDGGSITVSVADGSAVVSTPNGLPGVPVSAGGNFTDKSGQRWICDEIDFARGLYIQRCEKKVFDGTQGTMDYYSGYCRIQWKKQSATSCGVCDKFPWTTMYSNKGIGNNGTFFAVAGSLIGCSSVAEWKAWIAANPLTIQYALATPVETALTDDVIAAYKTLRMGDTVINDAGADMLVQYIADTKRYLDEREGEYELIETIVLEEDVARLTRTQKPDGTVYALKKLAVQLQGTTSTGTDAWANIYAPSGDKLLTSAKLSGTNANFYTTLSCAIENGRIVSNATGPGQGVTNSLGHAMFLTAAKAGYAAKVIDGFRLVLSNASFVAGTTIEIWGVRA